MIDIASGRHVAFRTNGNVLKTGVVVSRFQRRSRAASKRRGSWNDIVVDRRIDVRRNRVGPAYVQEHQQPYRYPLLLQFPDSSLDRHHPPVRMPDQYKILGAISNDIPHDVLPFAIGLVLSEATVLSEFCPDLIKSAGPGPIAKSHQQENAGLFVGQRLCDSMAGPATAKR